MESEIKVGWYVGFTNSKLFPKWLHRFFRFTHCYCFTATIEGILVVDPNQALVQMDILIPEVSETFIPNQLQKGDAILYVERTVDTKQFFCHCTPVNCVAAVKYILGLKSWAQTPYQLYRTLKKSGAKEYVRPN